jgi:hypothetical protein
MNAFYITYVEIDSKTRRRKSKGKTVQFNTLFTEPAAVEWAFVELHNSDKSLCRVVDVRPAPVAREVADGR